MHFSCNKTVIKLRKTTHLLGVFSNTFRYHKQAVIVYVHVFYGE